MSGRIKLKIRKSFPKVDKNGIQFRPDIKYYPGWIWKVYQEKYGGFDKINFVELMPSFSQLKEAFKEVLIHELQTDLIIKGRKEFRKWKNFMEKELPSLTEDININEIESKIPDVIKNCKR